MQQRGTTHLLMASSQNSQSVIIQGVPRRTSLRAQDYIDNEILSGSEISSSRASAMIHPQDEKIYLKIFSNFKEDDILVSNFRPKDKEQREHLQEIELKNQALQINCPQCETPEFCLLDVDQKDPVKMYFDSQIMSDSQPNSPSIYKNDLEIQNEENFSISQDSKSPSQYSQINNQNLSPGLDQKQQYRQISIFGSEINKQRLQTGLNQGKESIISQDYLEYMSVQFQSHRHRSISKLQKFPKNFESFQILSDIQNYFHNTQNATRRIDQQQNPNEKNSQYQPEVQVQLYQLRNRSQKPENNMLDCKAFLNDLNRLSNVTNMPNIQQGRIFIDNKNSYIDKAMKRSQKYSQDLQNAKPRRRTMFNKSTAIAFAENYGFPPTTKFKNNANFHQKHCTPGPDFSNNQFTNYRMSDAVNLQTSKFIIQGLESSQRSNSMIGNTKDYEFKFKQQNSMNIQENSQISTSKMVRRRSKPPIGGEQFYQARRSFTTAPQPRQTQIEASKVKNIE
eukprot:403363646